MATAAIGVLCGDLPRLGFVILTPTPCNKLKACLGEKLQVSLCFPWSFSTLICCCSVPGALVEMQGAMQPGDDLLQLSVFCTIVEHKDRLDLKLL